MRTHNRWFVDSLLIFFFLPCAHRLAVFMLWDTWFWRKFQFMITTVLTHIMSEKWLPCKLKWKLLARWDVNYYYRMNNPLTDLLTDVQTDWVTDFLTIRWSYRVTDRQTEWLACWLTDRQADRQIDRRINSRTETGCALLLSETVFQQIPLSFSRLMCVSPHHWLCVLGH